MKENLIAELKNLLDNNQSSTTAILNRAIQLAEAVKDEDFRHLFIYHLNGINKIHTEKITADQPKAFLMFSADRMKAGENFYLLGSLASLERNLENTKIDIERTIKELERLKSLPNTAPFSYADPTQAKQMALATSIGALRTSQLQNEEVISKIRNRVASFVRREERYLSKLQNKVLQSEIVRNKIFIGHGHSQAWRDLKDFLQDRLNLDWDEFNRESTAGLATKERLEDMLREASFAFLIMTGEDEHADQSLHARENVIHEIGLFQGKLGFRKAIILLEEGCKEFSNIIGLTQIRFPKGNIEAKFEEIRRVLEREGILQVRK